MTLRFEGKILLFFKQRYIKLSGSIEDEMAPDACNLKKELRSICLLMMVAAEVWSICAP